MDRALFALCLREAQTTSCEFDRVLEEVDTEGRCALAGNAVWLACNARLECDWVGRPARWSVEHARTTLARAMAELDSLASYAPLSVCLAGAKVHAKLAEALTHLNGLKAGA